MVTGSQVERVGQVGLHWIVELDAAILDEEHNAAGRELLGDGIELVDRGRGSRLRRRNAHAPVRSCLDDGPVPDDRQGDPRDVPLPHLGADNLVHRVAPCEPPRRREGETGEPPRKARRAIAPLDKTISGRSSTDLLPIADERSSERIGGSRRDESHHDIIGPQGWPGSRGLKSQRPRAMTPGPPAAQEAVSLFVAATSQTDPGRARETCPQ